MLALHEAETVDTKRLNTFEGKIAGMLNALD
jgi:hypothetical protein